MTAPITYIIGTNNVGADDDEIELIDAYRAEVAARLLERFPGASVNVLIENGSSKAIVDGLDWETHGDQLESVINVVNAIADDVWNHGNWHNAPGRG